MKALKKMKSEKCAGLDGRVIIKILKEEEKKKTGEIADKMSRKIINECLKDEDLSLSRRAPIFEGMGNGSLPSSSNTITGFNHIIEGSHLYRVGSQGCGVGVDFFKT